MAIKTAWVSSTGGGLRFEGSTGSGHDVVFDDVAGYSAARPTEVLLAALGACSAMDVLSILRRKRQHVRSYRVRVAGDQEEVHPHVFSSIRIVHELEGDELETAAVRRAIELSANRYCAISAMLSSGATRVSHWYTVRRATPGDDDAREVAVTGPHRMLGPAPPNEPPDAPRAVHRGATA